MARHSFPPDMFFQKGSGVTIILSAGAPFRVWDDREAGNDITASMTALDGSPLAHDGAGNILADSDGVRPWMLGPDTTLGEEVNVIYIDAVDSSVDRYVVYADDALDSVLSGNSTGFIEDPNEPGYFIPGSSEDGLELIEDPDDPGYFIPAGTGVDSFAEDPLDPGFYIPAEGTGGGGGSTGSTTAIVVAASDASAHSKAGADYLCDGADDEAQIVAALNALPSTGGRVILTEGTFSIASSVLIQNDNVTLIGAGAGQRTGATQAGVGTKLKAQTGSTITNAVILVQRAADDRPVYGTLLRDFTVDGNSIGTAVSGIHFRSNRAHIDHVHIHKCTGNGIRIQGYTSPQWDTYDTQLAFVQVGDCVDTGILLDTGAADCHMIHCILYNNNYGMQLKASSVQVTGCHFYDSALNNIYFNGGGSRSKFSNCKIEGAGQHGVNIDSTNGGYSSIQFTGCNFSNNGDSTDNTYDHIIQQGPSGNGIGRSCFVGNDFSWKGSGNKPRYGVNLNSSCSQSALVSGNTFGPASHFGTSAVRNNGSTSLPSLIGPNIFAPWNNWTTGSRPAANLFPIGAMIYNTTTTLPNWSDGTNWRDAAGTIV